MINGTAFSEDVLEGLTSTPKQLPSKWIYDERGDDLFLQVTKMPEYYLTSAEMEIFEYQSQSMIKQLNVEDMTPNIDIIELGAGDGQKSLLLLRSLNEQNIKFQYIPIDISSHSLDALECLLRHELPTIYMRKQQGDYLKALNNLRDATDDWNIKSRIVLFLGNSIGNMIQTEAEDFIFQLLNFLEKGDKLVLGVDLIKSDTVILPAYSGPRNLNFKLNMLKRINDELGGNFDLTKFSNKSTYTKEEGILRDFIECDERQEVYVRAIDTRFELDKGESIQIDMSYKYDDYRVNKLFNNKKANFVCKLTDNRGYFADYIYECM